MAVYTSFDAFIASTNGQAIGNGECWDYVNLIWTHLGSRYWTYPPSDPSATNHGIKWGVLNAEALTANTIEHLTFISDKTQLKKGDIVISTDGDYGHGGFITSDYDPNITTYQFYSQNYGGRRTVGLDSYTLSDFGGAFRYDAWQDPEPVVIKKHKFPWVIYANKLRNKR